MNRKTRLAIASAIAVSLALAWLFILSLPVVRATSENYPNELFFGTDILVMGPLGLLMGEAGWGANITFFLMIWLLFHRPRLLAIWTIPLALHILAALDALNWKSWPGDEGGVTRYRIDEYLPGYYAWLSLMLTAPVVVLVWHFLDRRSSQSD